MVGAMSNQAAPELDFFLGIMVQNDGKWKAVGKMDGGSVASALKKAEDLDKSSKYDAVKVLRISKDKAGGAKELWYSSKLEAQREAARANRLSSALKESANNMGPKRSS